MRRLLTLFLACTLPLAAECRLRIDLKAELTPFDTGIIEKSATWDFGRQSTIDDNAAAYTRAAAGIIYESVGERCRAYAFRGDTLFYRGYNAGRREKMLVESMVPVRTSALRAGEYFENGFHARGAIDVDFLTAESGSHRSEVAAEGTAIVHGDTLRNVVLLKETFNCIKYAAGDTLADRCGEREHTVIYRWLCREYVLPFAVQYVTGSGTDRLFVADRIQIADMPEGEIPSGDYDDEGSIQKCLESAYARKAAEGIEVGFAETAPSRMPIELYLIDAGGNAYARSTGMLGEQCLLAIPHGLHGQYIIAVVLTERPRLNHKFMIGL